ncbi:hypothetical protein MKL09_11445 [Methylobacterium sp. J-048]|uniref:hypothetical protein n=1 Tax=Methylobacterium sp. J-048 TaxID=2836635 RepID=UPI001FB8E1E0|nr:hypothetical protein [Methylobacterium sp. J-048]MCJ2057168.1 hypothetical protein [Methylobacterium sp. J-048]
MITPRMIDHLVRTDYMVFIHRVFLTLNPGIPFAPSWHLDAMAEALARVHDGRETRLVIAVPPRSGKSIMTSIGFAAWRLGHDPRRRVICVSSEDSLVRSLAASFRAVVASEWYRDAFPAFRIARGGDRATETVTTAGGYRFGVPLGGSVFGRGADLIIADDAMSPQAALSETVRRRELGLWDTKFPSRLNDKRTGAIVVVGQRLHEDDLVGHLTRENAA